MGINTPEDRQSIIEMSQEVLREHAEEMKRANDERQGGPLIQLFEGIRYDDDDKRVVVVGTEEELTAQELDPEDFSRINVRQADIAKYKETLTELNELGDKDTPEAIQRVEVLREQMQQIRERGKTS